MIVVAAIAIGIVRGGDYRFRIRWMAAESPSFANARFDAWSGTSGN